MTQSPEQNVPQDVEDITAFIASRGNDTRESVSGDDFEAVLVLTRALDTAVAHLGGQLAWERARGTPPRAAFLWKALTDTAARWENHPDFKPEWSHGRG
ncbi:hypothetical protein ACFVTY_02120 [Streptomyces sp. NPDC058067]|uniref:hypothetical protein n=1 Tax=Streptomyces sp. NPDC058067 TaxID=3346324 RepID=UPI0036E48FAB